MIREYNDLFRSKLAFMRKPILSDLKNMLESIIVFLCFLLCQTIKQMNSLYFVCRKQGKCTEAHLVDCLSPQNMSFSAPDCHSCEGRNPVFLISFFFFTRYQQPDTFFFCSHTQIINGGNFVY